VAAALILPPENFIALERYFISEFLINRYLQAPIIDEKAHSISRNGAKTFHA